MSISTCCLKTFKWNGTPAGQIGTLANNQTYIASPPTTNPASTKSTTAILIVHDMLGWTFPNARLLADHYATEANATVYIPDFFGGEVLPFEPLLAGRFHEVDLPGFKARNAREVREPEIFECAETLREKYNVVIAVGFCYGGWAVFRLGAQHISQDGREGRPLVDAITAAHPSLLTKEDIDGVTVPVQILAPELKGYTFESLQRRGVPFDWQHFPGVEHACMTRGDESKPGERRALERGKNAVVAWVKHIEQA